jgi:ABC-type phosphate transport system substrate-binding protein
MKNIYILTFILFVLFPFASGYGQSSTTFKIIVNKENSTVSLTKEKVSKLFLKKTSKWDDGQKVTPVDHKPTAKVRINFTKVIHKKNVAAIIAYWQKKIFTGKGVPPAEMSNDKEVIAFVKANPGAIGYISKNTSSQGVNVIELSD